MARGRGRPPITQAEKDRRANEREANAAADWASAMPKDEEQRKEPFIGLAAAKDEFKAKSKELKDKLRIGTFEGSIKAHGWEKQIVSFFLMMEGKTPAMQTRIWRQMQQMAEDAGWNAQNDLFDTGGMGETRSDGAVFDKTATGERTGGAPIKAETKAATETAPVDTGKLSEEEALKRFEENKAKGESKRASRAKKAEPPAAVPETDPNDDRPRHLRQADADRKAEAATKPAKASGKAKPDADKKPSTKKPKPASPAAQAAKDAGIGEGGEDEGPVRAPLGVDADAPGGYVVH